ncbi:hypothetical protein BT93_F3164 [Corymbia citriodora subsp. variegata]|nr:hypothetical protein BT93_F3164 [Corymbia citriodora subsp. variegata]
MSCLFVASLHHLCSCVLLSCSSHLESKYFTLVPSRCTCFGCDSHFLKLKLCPIASLKLHRPCSCSLLSVLVSPLIQVLWKMDQIACLMGR